MKTAKNYYVVAVLVLAILFIFSGVSFSEEVAIESDQSSEKPEFVEPEINWMWGEVVSVDNNSGQIEIKYIDYDTEIEKTETIHTSADTTYENVSGLAQIKSDDTISIDYSISDDNSIIAKHIAIEKLEDLPIADPESSLPGADDLETE